MVGVGPPARKKIRKKRRETLDSRGVVPIIGPILHLTFRRGISARGEEKEVIMRSTRICKRVYDVSVRDIPEG